MVEKAIDDDTSGIFKMIGGGSGSGKSEVVLTKIKDSPAVIFDGTLGGLDSAVAKIEYALSKNKKIELHPVYTPVELATLFNRMRGRTVMNTVLKDTHFGFRDNIPKLIDKYGDKIKVIPYQNKMFDFTKKYKGEQYNGDVRKFIDSQKMSKDEVINAINATEYLIRMKGSVDLAKKFINSIL